MKFIIASLSRCASTAVYRVLGSDPALDIAYEPPFFDDGLDIGRIGKRTSRYFRRCDGLKHVWDPNGWPFRNPDHVSSLDALAKADELVSPNTAVLECAERIVLLRRRNAFDRTLSDLWGQQTNLWGNDHRQPHDASAVQEYKAAARRHVPRAIDADVFGWYMRNAEVWEDSIVRGLPASRLKTFFYEDLFGPCQSQARLPAWRALAEWVSSRPDFSSAEVQGIISPESKLNSADIYERIPNFRELKAAFSSGQQADASFP